MTLQLAGRTIGNLTVLRKYGREYVKASRVFRTLWECKCLCGKIVLKKTQALSGKSPIGCGCCEWHIHHNEAYNSWMGMKSRCNTVSCKDYAGYGGRGITYQPSWELFTEFYKDMGDPPTDSSTGERMSLDRRDNNGNYTKDNCKWSTRSEQQTNKDR